MSDLTKAPSPDLTETKVDLEIVNGGVPTDYYSNNPCLVGFAYLRFEVSGKISPCCIAKHSVGSAYDQDWRDVWHSGAQENFRRKMSRIHVEKFHRVDPEWVFCQQCSHLDLNIHLNEELKRPREET